MIKVDGSDPNDSMIRLRGDRNLVLNELRVLTKYSIQILGPVALEAINDGAKEALEELEAEEHDKDIRS